MKVPLWFIVVAAMACSGAETMAAPRVTTLEIVTDNAAPGDGGNCWGGHQCRIVRTQDGVFTAYTVPGEGYKSKQWRLVQRRDGAWHVLAGGIAGREPVNLLASPDGTLHVIGWPGGKGTIWSGKPKDGQVDMQASPIPGVIRGDWPYGSAGIDREGNLCVLSSEGGKPGAFRWAFYRATPGSWTSGITPIDYRYCYTYVIPHSSGGLAIVSTRDVTWDTLGYQKPEGVTFDYVFNAFRYWETSDIDTAPQEKAFVEEKPTAEVPYVHCNAQSDAYLDTDGRMHVLYRISGPGTGQKDERRHAAFAADGKLLHEEALPAEAGVFCRIFQDDRKDFWILGSAGLIYPLGPDGLTVGQPTKLDLRGHKVEYSGFGVSAPRTGTLPGNSIDVVFPSGKGTQWIYCRVLLHDDEVREAPQSDARVILDRYRQMLLGGAPPDAKQSRELAASLAADGRWPDVDYDDATGSSWRPSTHLARIRMLALALVHPKSPLAGDAAVKAAALRALDHWLDKRYQCPNWWWNRIGVPMTMRDIMVLLEPELSAERLDKGWQVVAQSGWIDMTGANLVWVAGLAMFRAAQAEDEELIAQASARIAFTIRVGAAEGIQKDFSFYQHGARLQSFHYGWSFASDVCRLAWLLRDTPWAIPEGKLAIMADYLLEGTDWMRRGQFTVPGTQDRAVSRPGALSGKRLAGDLRLLREAAPAQAGRIDAAIAREEGRTEPLTGFRHFPWGDFTVYHRRDFSFFVKTASLRTMPTEQNVNNENLKGGLLHSGDAYFVRDGREYYNLMPVWDWDLLPGVTWSAGAPRKVERGDFVGGLGDGDSGLAAMACAFGEGAPALSARKAWFCHGDLAVHLIGDIQAPTLEQPVRTALDQCRGEGDVTVAAGRKRETVGEATSRRFEEVSWLHHRGVAYVLLSPASVTLSIGAVSGSWQSINAGQSAAEVTERVFLAVMEHGARPEGASAAYLLAPAASADDAAALAARPGVEVLANDGSCQAVRFSDGTMMAAFFAAGALQEDGRALLVVDAPCLVMVRGGELRACNPAFKAVKATIEAAGIGRVQLDLPGEGASAKGAP